MTDERDIDVLDELSALLDVEPSAAFAAHVRNAIERDKPRWFSWRVIGFAGVGAAMAGLVAMILMPHQRAAVSPARVASSAAQVPTAPRTTVPPRVGGDQSSNVPSKPRSRVATGDGDLLPVVTNVDGFEVIVPADQRLALARLVSGVRAGRFGVPPEVSPKYDADGLLLPLAPVTISAIPDPVPAPIDLPATERDPKGSQREKR